MSHEVLFLLNMSKKWPHQKGLLLIRQGRGHPQVFIGIGEYVDQELWSRSYTKSDYDKEVFTGHHERQ